MSPIVLQLLPLAVTVAFTTLPIAATLVILVNARDARGGWSISIGYYAGLLVVLGVATFGFLRLPALPGDIPLVTVAELVVGVALVVLGAHRVRRHVRKRNRSSSGDANGSPTRSPVFRAGLGRDKRAGNPAAGTRAATGSGTGIGADTTTRAATGSGIGAGTTTGAGAVAGSGAISSSKSGASSGLMSRLEGISVPRAAALGFSFALHPENLLLCATASARITSDGSSWVERAVLIVCFAAVGVSTVVIPTAFYAAAANRVRPLLRDARNWLARNDETVMSVLLLVVGVVLSVVGLWHIGPVVADAGAFARSLD